MTRAELVARLRDIDSLLETDRYDLEGWHKDADKALLEYINDPEVTAVYDAIPKCYI